MRNIAKFSPKMAKKTHFSIFSIFSQTVHTIRTKASQKEKDLSRLLYRICGSGLIRTMETAHKFTVYIRNNKTGTSKSGAISAAKKAPFLKCA